MALAIIINTVVLSLDKYPVNLALIGILEKVNIVFILIFSIEMIIKMVHHGCRYVEVGIPDRHDNQGRRSKAFRWQNIKGIAAFLARTWWDVHVARNYFE